MTVDVQQSVDALRHAVGAIERALVSGDEPTGVKKYQRLFGHVLAFARLLRDDVIIAAAVRDLVNAPSERDVVHFREIEAQLRKEAERILYELGDAYRDRNHPWRHFVDSQSKMFLRRSE